MEIISHISRIQAIDKVAAYLAQVNSQFSNVNHTVVLELETRRNKAPSCQILFELLAQNTNKLVLLGENNLHSEAKSVFANYRVPVDQFAPTGTSKHYSGEIFSIFDNFDVNSEIKPKTAYFVQRNRIFSPTAISIYNKVLASEGRVLRFFKSLHDRASGLTALPKKKNMPQIFHDIKRRFFSTELNKSEDYLLVHGPEFRRSILAAGVNFKKMAQIAYPLCLPAWKKLIANQLGQDNKERIFTIALFTRGEIEDGRSSDTQVLPKESLQLQLNEVFSVFSAIDFPYLVIVKPHPNQNAEELSFLLRQYKNVSITFAPPSIIAYQSDLSIGFDTSAILDSLFMNKPAINYSHASKGLLLNHPKGSIAKIMGIPTASDKKTLRDFVKNVREGEKDLPDIEAFVGTNFSMTELLNPLT